MIVNKGYHTLDDRGNASQIEENGPIGCKKVNIAWLGLGYYFWDSSIFWAHFWGEKIYKTTYLIFEANIIRDNAVYDLFGEVEHINEFIECVQEVKNMQENGRRHDILVSEVIEYIKEYTKFSQTYNAIRCADYPERPNIIAFRHGKPEKMIIGGERVQYCLLNKNNIIKDSFKLVYPKNL